MAKYSNKESHFDAVIVGDSLTSFILATILQADKKVAIIHPGQKLRETQSLAYIPKTEEALEAIGWMERLLDCVLVEKILEHAPLCIESGQLIPFSGFGPLKFASHQQLDYYNAQEYIQLNLSTEGLGSRLLELYSGEILSNCELTSIEVEAEKVTSITVNGEKKICADQFIFCDSPKSLLALIDPESINNKFIQKVGKIKEWSGVQLCYEHAQPISDQSHLHILFGSKTDFEPCLGGFMPAKDGAAQQSIWMSLVPADEAEDSEHLGAVVRYMKRQIKRAYSDLGELLSEKITVFPGCSGESELDAMALRELSKLENAYWASSILSNSEGLLGSFEISRQLGSELSSSLETGGPVVPPPAS